MAKHPAFLNDPSPREQADALYGSGNNAVTTTEITNAIQGILAKHPNDTAAAAQEILNGAVEHRISAQQIADTGLFTKQQVDDYLASKGITPARTTQQLSTNLETAEAQFGVASQAETDAYLTAYTAATNLSSAREHLQLARALGFVGLPGSNISLADLEASVDSANAEFDRAYADYVTAWDNLHSSYAARETAQDAYRDADPSWRGGYNPPEPRFRGGDLTMTSFTG